jgi:TonB family protein
MTPIQTIALAAPLFVVLSGAVGCGGAAEMAEGPVPPVDTASPEEKPTPSDKDLTGNSNKPDGTTEGQKTRSAEITEGAQGDSAEKKEAMDDAFRSKGGAAGSGPGTIAAGGPGSPPPPPAQASVNMGSTPLGGRLSQKDIGEILSKNSALFNDCYTIGAAGGQSFTGTVTVKATLGPTGSVSDAQVIKSTAKNQKVDTCVVQAFKKIKFPTPKDGATSVITFPMEFNGVEQIR